MHGNEAHLIMKGCKRYCPLWCYIFYFFALCCLISDVRKHAVLVDQLCVTSYLHCFKIDFNVLQCIVLSGNSQTLN